ncbi:hypothetical protein [Bacillus sp. B-jedd]|uniref:hypothetical protein n=1 Tax=Bacillus sp. B-jedd TaxID=1476857 RepID=UPI0005156BD4|nr:hypothetical protein [Bacillus sp. B-jedd]CEG28059.1 hypothetical protein BN1002_02938 [Bacillus sp. B-jedd]
MSWISFMSGVLVTIFAYNLFTYNIEEDGEEVFENEIEINGFSGRLVTLSCQTCRKLKKHRELQPSLYQCTRCNRYVDLRAS